MHNSLAQPCHQDQLQITLSDIAEFTQNPVHLSEIKSFEGDTIGKPIGGGVSGV